MAPDAAPRLSICMATFGRGAFIEETLASFLDDLPPGVEVIVVDGASPDDTPQAMARCQARWPGRVDYHREPMNAGVDRDFDKAVGYARGQWCWLLSDDDLLVPGAVQEVLGRLDDGPDLVVVNARVEDKSLTRVLKPRQMDAREDAVFASSHDPDFFTIAAPYLSFIGAVVVRREAWLARDRTPFYGSLFIHVGVIFSSPPLAKVKLLARPLIRIRYGNALWTARGFEIWSLLWPRMVWTLGPFGDAERGRVVPRHPALHLRSLLWYRAIGALTPQALQGVRARSPVHPWAAGIAAAPVGLLNGLLAVYLVLKGGSDATMKLYDLARAQGGSRIAALALRRSRSPGTER